MAELKSQQELLTEYFQEIQSRDPSLTDDVEGSKLDTLGGAFTTAVQEAQKTVVTEFRKTFIDTANGPEVTGGVDDLEKLLVDHWGEDFARPEPTPAVGVVTFSRANTDAGNVEILAGTIVKTRQNAAGNSQSFRTLSDVTMVGLSIQASVEALQTGPEGNVDPATVVEIETSLTDPTVVVTNALEFSGGANTLTDAEYREFARFKLATAGGGTLEAIEAAALTVPGVAFANGREFVKKVIEWDEAEGEPIGEPFLISYAVLYVADVNGNASAPLLAAVKAAVDEVKAGGVDVRIEGAVVFTLNWIVEITLDSNGPNFATLSVNPQPIIDTMTQYLQDLEVGEGFDKDFAEGYVLDIWGFTGTGDITDLVSITPSANVAVDPNEKIVPGNVEID